MPFSKCPIWYVYWLLSCTPPLIGIPGLWMVETLDSLKLANKLNTYWGLREFDSHSLKVLVQVNTSKEECEYACA